MTTYPMHYTDNANSWRRMYLLLRLYWPGLKDGIIVWALTPLVLTLISALIARLSGHMVDFVFQWPLSVMLYVSPIILTKRDYRDISAQLPVTAIEKLGFLLLLFWVVMPGIVCLSEWVAEGISALIFGPRILDLLNGYERQALALLDDIDMPLTFGRKVVNYISMICVITVVLYYVVTAKKNRVAAGFISWLCVVVGLVLVCGIIDGVMGALQAIHGGANLQSEAALQGLIEENVLWVACISVAITVILGLIYTVKLYKKLRNCGF